MKSREYLEIYKKRDELQKTLYSIMAANNLDVILYPHQSVLVATIAEGDQKERNDVLSNATGFPAITFQEGFSSQ